MDMWNFIKRCIDFCSLFSTEVLLQLPGSEDLDVQKLNDHLYELYKPAEARDQNVEIIFIHGFREGDYERAFFETWLSLDGSECSPKTEIRSAFWPKMWIPKMFPKARVASVSYDSSAVRDATHGRYDFFTTGEGLIQSLVDMNGKVAEKKGCPLILVGHDLGGLVVKAICLAAKEQEKQSFLRNLKGIFYYATPHLGLPNLNPVFEGPLVKRMKVLDAKMQRLNEKFRKLRQEYKWKARMMIPAHSSEEPQFDVSEAAARYDADSFYTAQSNTRDICRPEAMNSSSFTYLTDFIDECMRRRSTSVNSTIRFEDDSNYVPPTDLMDELRNALLKSEVRVVVLCGGPGTGKSSLAKYLSLRFLDEQPSSFPDGVYYLSCGYDAEIMEKQRELLDHFTTTPEDLITTLEIQDCGSSWNGGIPAVGASKRKGRKMGSSKVYAKAVAVKRRQHPTTVDMDGLHKKLLPHLKELEALIVLDDVWSQKLIEKLMVPGRVKYLVTTQDAKVWGRAGNSQMIEMRKVGTQDALRILGNYAGLRGGSIPKTHLDDAHDILRATEHHPLALATLGTVISLPSASNDWRDLNRNIFRCLREEDPVISFSEKYPKSVHASMMSAVKLLKPAEKLLLYTISLFEGPSIPDKFVELFWRCTQSAEMVESYFTLKLRLERLMLVSVQREKVSPYGITDSDNYNDELFEKRNRGAFYIHGLRQHFVLATGGHPKELGGIMDFIGNTNPIPDRPFRTNHELATALLALYGSRDIKEKAIRRMGKQFKCFEFDGLAYLSSALRWIVSLMLIKEGEASTSKSSDRGVATEVLWKILNEGKLHDEMISELLVEESYPICCFLTSLIATFESTHYEVHATAIPKTLQGLVNLMVEDVNEICRAATLTVQALALAPQNKVTIVEFPNALEALVRLLGDEIIESVQEPALSALHNLSIMITHKRAVRMLGTTGLMQKVVRFLENKEMKKRRGTATSILMNLTVPTENKVLIGKFPGALEALVGLLADDVEEAIQEDALGALLNLLHLKENAVRMVGTTGLLKMLVGFLENKEMRKSCGRAAHFIMNLAAPMENKVLIGQFPGALKALVGLLADDVEEAIQEDAVGALCYLSRVEENRVRMVGTTGLLKMLVEFLENKEMKERCGRAALLIMNLCLSMENKVLIGQFPGALKALVGLLADDDEEGIQEDAMGARSNKASLQLFAAEAIYLVAGSKEMISTRPIAFRH